MIDAGDIMVDGRLVPVAEPIGGGVTAAVLIRQAAAAFIEREPRRARCSRCRVRRVLYRIGIRTILQPPEFTEARCAECWGIRVDD